MIHILLEMHIIDLNYGHWPIPSEVEQNAKFATGESEFIRFFISKHQIEGIAACDRLNPNRQLPTTEFPQSQPEEGTNAINAANNRKPLGLPCM